MNAYVRSGATFIGLTILTIVEFIIAQNTGGSAVFLFIIALIKAALIFEFFMHISNLWGGDSHA